MAVEIHPATVVNTADPEKRGRIRVTCVGIMGDEETELPFWIEPIQEWGWFNVPDVGEIVDLESLAGDNDDRHGQAATLNFAGRWRGRHWGGAETDVKRPVPTDFTAKNYGKRRGFATPWGHVLMFDDTEGQQQVSLTWHGAKNEYGYLGFDKEGSFVASNKKGSMLYLNAKSKQAALMDENGNSITTSEKGIAAIDSNGNSFEMKDGVVQVLSAGKVILKCQDAHIQAGTIELTEGAGEAIVLGDTFMNSVFKEHIHPSGMGPTGKPIPTGAEASALSKKVKTG